MNVSNHLREELYKELIPLIIQEDLKTGVFGPVKFWNDPILKWNDGSLWNQKGLLPVIKNLFFAIEREGELELAEIDGLPDLVDPDKAPVDFLEAMAESLGLPFSEDLSEAGKREHIKSIIELQKKRGTALSWEIFYRVLGFDVQAFPLWKKDINEANDQYSRQRYETQNVTGEVIGTVAATSFAGATNFFPIKPGTVRITDGSVFIKDESSRLSSNFGKLFTSSGFVGEINYATGRYSIQLGIPTVDSLTIDYEEITNEFPYHAARVDLEVFFVPSENGEFSTPIDDNLINRLLNRLEEVRPIQVLLRALIIKIVLEDTLEDFAAELRACPGPEMGKDERDVETRLYLVDKACIRGESIFFYERSDIAQKNVVFEDEYSVTANPDNLIIEFSNGSPTQFV